MGCILHQLQDELRPVSSLRLLSLVQVNSLSRRAQISTSERSEDASGCGGNMRVEGGREGLQQTSACRDGRKLSFSLQTGSSSFISKLRSAFVLLGPPVQTD